MSITGKMSTIMRVIDNAPISRISIAAIAEVYGRRKASRTRPIIAAPLPCHIVPNDTIVAT